MTGEVKRYTKADEKLAFKFYKEYVTGRGYVWSPECTLSEDVQGAILAAIVFTRADHLAVVEGLRADALMSAYKLGTVDMLAARATGLEAIEEACADDLDGLWRQMTKEQRDLINAWCAILPPAWTSPAIDEAMRP